MKVSELIKKLQALECQDAVIAIEAPFYVSESKTPYRWPDTDFCLIVTDVEEENDTDGESYLLKTWFEDGKIPKQFQEKTWDKNKIMEAVDSLKDKLSQIKSQHLTVRVNLPNGQNLAITGIEDEIKREDVDSISLEASY